MLNGPEELVFCSRCLSPSYIPRMKFGALIRIMTTSRGSRTVAGCGSFRTCGRVFLSIGSMIGTLIIIVSRSNGISFNGCSNQSSPRRNWIRFCVPEERVSALWLAKFLQFSAHFSDRVATVLGELFFCTLSLRTSRKSHVNSDRLSGIFRCCRRYSKSGLLLFTGLNFPQVVGVRSPTTKRELVHNP